VTKSVAKRLPRPLRAGLRKSLPEDYFRIRDFEYVQPLYDLAFLLEVDALSKGAEIPQYRTFSLWRAAYSLDGYGTVVDRWLDGCAQDADLDYVPSARIREYLKRVRSRGTLPELRAYRSETFNRTLRLRSVRGLGPSKIALTVSSRSLADEWFSQAAINLTLNRDRITELYYGSNVGPWQTAHVVPPLLRFLARVQQLHGEEFGWNVSGISDPFEPITSPVTITPQKRIAGLDTLIGRALKNEKLFRRAPATSSNGIFLKHQMGWTFTIEFDKTIRTFSTLSKLTKSLDPLADDSSRKFLSDLHMHTLWSDGSASLAAMASAAASGGLQYIAITDHSRSSKLQGGLTPLLWIRQASAFSIQAPACSVLHGIEVDILRDGSLDLPGALLEAADIVVASVHSNWSDNPRINTDRILRAIETGYVDILAHPTSAIIGKPGVPDYLRTPADLHWDEVFEKCALWKVAVEMNCFPSRLDLPLDLLRNAVLAGCTISFGSDAHARSHLLNLRFGEAAILRLPPGRILNNLSYEQIRDWIRESRAKRRTLTASVLPPLQAIFPFESDKRSPGRVLTARVRPPQNIPAGARIVGIDLTAGDKPTGLAVLNDFSVETSSAFSDDEILAYVSTHRPAIVSIDSPLGLPGGGEAIDPKAGIVRIAEQDLASIGIPAYPALIDSMRKLTLRGIRLRKAIEQSDGAPTVIESYPGAAQDILCIPRKQKGLELLRDGLRRLGLNGNGLDTRSHDEMDAITSAIVGRYYEAGLFEPMGISNEAQLIVPKVQSLAFENAPIICLAGKTCAGKSVAARYLSTFYGFEWIHTRDLIRELLLEDAERPSGERRYHRRVDRAPVSEIELREFGALILDVYKQQPLRTKLAETIRRRSGPVVVDAIRDTVDVQSRDFERPVLVWFVHCEDSIIRHRLTTRTKLGEKRLKTGSPVDHSAAFIRNLADNVISNNGSLEELRWRVDDALFSGLRLLS
jgi:histidinol phosphatase-like PHP family hydrolase/predicted nuclease with RNAse H fold/dephospho-CoA kinase